MRRHTCHLQRTRTSSDIVVRGSQVKAGGVLRLQAEGDIALQAAQEQRQEESQQSSKSASVGASIGASGVSGAWRQAMDTMVPGCRVF